MPSQNNEFRPLSVPTADAMGGFDETGELGGRVVRGDPRGAIAKQILAILEPHSGSA